MNFGPINMVRRQLGILRTCGLSGTTSGTGWSKPAAKFAVVCVSAEFARALDHAAGRKLRALRWLSVKEEEEAQISSLTPGIMRASTARITSLLRFSGPPV